MGTPLVDHTYARRSTTAADSSSCSRFGPDPGSQSVPLHADRRSARVRRAGAPRISFVWRPRERLRPLPLRRVSARDPGRLLVQRPGLLSVMLRAPDGGPGRTPDRPRSRRPARAAAGPDASAQAPLHARLGPQALSHRARRLHPGALDVRAPPSRAPRHPRRAWRSGDRDPALRIGAQPERPLPQPSPFRACSSTTGAGGFASCPIRSQAISRWQSSWCRSRGGSPALPSAVGSTSSAPPRRSTTSIRWRATHRFLPGSAAPRSSAGSRPEGVPGTRSCASAEVPKRPLHPIYTRARRSLKRCERRRTPGSSASPMVASVPAGPRGIWPARDGMEIRERSS